MNERNKPRIDPPLEGQLDSAQRQVYDAITAGPRGEVVGPLGVWLWRPELADRAQRFGEYARYNTCLPSVLSELAILVVARFWVRSSNGTPISRSRWQRAFPLKPWRRFGVGGVPSLEESDQTIVYEFSRTLLEQRSVDDELYSRRLLRWVRQQLSIWLES